MCCVIKLELNLNQTVIRFNKPTNTDSAAAPTCHIHAVFLDIFTSLFIGYCSCTCSAWGKAHWLIAIYRGHTKASEPTFWSKCCLWTCLFLDLDTLKYAHTHILSGLARAGLTSGRNDAELWKAIFHDVSHWPWHEPRKIQLSLELSVGLSGALCLCPFSLAHSFTNMVCDNFTL